MKYRFLVAALYFTTGVAQASPIAFDRACWSEVDSGQYLTRGDRTTSFVGARLWDLDRLRKTWARSSGEKSSCFDKIFEQALSDQSEYWDYVGNKYGCRGAAATAEVAEAYRASRCELYDDSQSYLRFATTVAKGPPGCSSEKPCAGCPRGSYPSHEVERVAGKWAIVLPAVLITTSVDQTPKQPDPCAEVPAHERRASGSTSGKLLVAQLGECGIGLVQGIWRELRRFAGSAVNIVNGEFFSGMAAFAKAFYDNPGKVVDNIIAGVMQFFTEDFENFACYSEEYQSRQICQFTGKLVANVAVGAGMAKLAQAGVRGVAALVRANPGLVAAFKALKPVTAKTIPAGAAAKKAVPLGLGVAGDSEAAAAKAAAMAEEAAAKAKAAAMAEETAAKAARATKAKAPPTQEMHARFVEDIKRVTGASTCAALKSAYRALVMIYHPDRIEVSPVANETLFKQMGGEHAGMKQRLGCP